MPPKRRRVSKGWKGELLFTEAPKEGLVYPYGAPLHPGGSPRCVPTKPVNQIGSTWIIPQFESARSLGLQSWCHGSPNVKIKDTNHAIPVVAGRRWRPAACKFSPLMFENAKTESCAVGTSEHPLDFGGQAGNFETCCNQPRALSTPASISPTSNSRAGMENPCPCPLSPYADPVAFSPPERCTPEQPSIEAHHYCLPQMDSFTPGPFSNHVGEDISNDFEATSVLVKDTPEDEYGVKVTWRSRSLLMKYLREKGMLSTRDVLVKTQMSAVLSGAEDSQ
uniref:RAD9-HUS1-RAD1 interacting nuclear orphan 1 n=1 Tax=Podarcis muralis TaxID=64176 RepID=A0A670JUU2_PODMU|nr:RAD9, HUS1, RAD1-interacting nuclear orphan protein 1 [Podarcis muralis]